MPERLTRAQLDELQASYAGCRRLAYARSTGTLVGVYSGAEAGLCTDDGRSPWSTVCEEHGSICGHETLKLARWHAPCPDEWCEECG